MSWLSGKAFYQAILQTLSVSFVDDCPTSPASIWDQVESPLTGTESFDPILYTDSQTGRTIVSQLLLRTTTSASAFTNDDGRTWFPSTGAGIASGIDHQTLGGGPFHAPVPSGVTYQNAVYYCARDIADANCAISLDGGMTYGPAVPIYTSQSCSGLHGHVKVGPDGTAYVPNKGCGTGQGVVVSEDNGVTWHVYQVPGTLPANSDPYVAVDKGGRVYLGLANNNNHPVVAVSDDHGRTWKNIYDVGTPFGLNNVVFPAMVAGDKGRASFVFHGTSASGDLQGLTFPGVWHLYVATTYDGGASWITADATPNDPTQRGCIWLQGGGNICRNLLDFMDATVDAQGRVLVGYADGCRGPCAQAPATGTGNGYSATAAIARQTGGRRMFAAFDPQEPTNPSAPSLTVTRNGAVARLTWSEGNDGGSPITGYKVLRGTVSGQEKLLATAGKATRYDDPTIDPRTTYFYKIVATNSMGDSCGSTEVAAAPSGSSCVPPGVVVVNDAAGDQKGAPLNTQLDVRSVSILEPFYADGSQKLTFVVKVADLSAVPANAQWRILWNSPNAPSGQFYVGMSSDQNTNVTFEYGTVDVTSAVVTSVGVFTKLGAADPASGFTADGTITIVVPNAKVGGLKAGDLIGGLVARTYLVTGSVATSGRTAIDVTDSPAEPYLLVGNAYCAPPTSACLEDDDAHIAYGNGWHLVSDPDASGGHFRFSGGKGSATLAFDVPAGQFGAVTYFYATSPKGATAKVTLDGVYVGTIDFHGSSGKTKAPVFGASQRFAGLNGGSHRLVITPNGNGPAYADKFCLESSFSNAQPASGPGTTATSSGTLAPGQQLVQSLTLPAGTTAISVVTESSLDVPFQVVFVDPSGAVLQTANGTVGLAVLEGPASAGMFVVKVLNLSLGPVDVWSVATPLVAR